MRAQILIAVILFTCLNLFAQWEKKHTFTGVGYAVDGKTTNFIVLATGSKVFYSTNGGANWSEKTFAYCTDVSVIDENNFWVVTGFGKIFKLNTSGSESQQYYDATKVGFFNYIEMFDVNNGIAMGDKLTTFIASVLKTTNSGTNWNITSGSDLNGMWSGDLWRRIDFVNMNVGYFFESGVDPQKLLKTTNGGANWSATNFNANAQVIKFFNENIGLAYETGNVYRTTNGGTTWDTISIPLATGWGNDIEFIPNDSMKVWLLTANKLFYSSNFGNDWIEVNVDTEEFTGRDIHFIDNNNGWLLCDNKVYCTNNGGLSDISDTRKEIPTEFSLEQNYPNPFNPTTTIRYSIPLNVQGQMSKVILKVFNVLGQEIATLVNEEKAPGVYEVKFDATNLTSGIYFYRIETPNFIDVKKMVLVK